MRHYTHHSARMAELRAIIEAYRNLTVEEAEDTDAGVLPVGPVDQWVDVVGNPGEEGTAARGDLPTEWAGAWSSMLLPLVGVALFVLYFLFLRRRRKDEEDDGVEALATDGYTFS